MAKPPIMFVHGLWMHSSTWDPWMAFFSEKGYEVSNPGWPGDSETVAASRENSRAIANRGVKEVAGSYAKVIGSLSTPPILIGHSFGGMLVQELLGRGIAAAAVAIDPAPIKGVWQLPLSTIRASLPIIGNPFNLTKAVSLSYDEFRYAFANAVPEEEAKELYDRATMPAPARPLFQAATATLNPFSETRINTTSRTRGPLLIISGEEDHIVPPVLVKAAFRKYQKSSATTDFKSFTNRGHSLVIDHGWHEIAEYSLGWLNKNGL